MSKKVLVTGGRGFIGSYVVNRLLAEGRRVMVFDRHAIGPDPDPDVEVFLGDIRDATAVTEAMAHVDSWIHLAGVLGTQEAVANPVPAAETNVIGGLRVLEAAAQYHLPGVNIAVGNWFEDNTYSLTKNCVERFCNMYRTYRSLPVTVVRALNAYGPHQSIAAPYGSSQVRKIMPSFICRALTGAPIEVYGDGLQIMDMVPVAAVADVLVRALLHTEEHGPVGHVLEAGSGRRTTVLDIAQTVLKTVGQGEIVYLPMRAGESEHAVVVADTSTLATVGVDATQFTSLEDGVAEAVAWYREHWLPVWLDEQRAAS